jgi:hypothetical protein
MLLLMLVNQSLVVNGTTYWEAVKRFETKRWLELVHRRPLELVPGRRLLLPFASLAVVTPAQHGEYPLQA